MIIHVFVLSTILKRVLLVFAVSPLLILFQVTGDNLEEAIVKVAEGNILDEI